MTNSNTKKTSGLSFLSILTLIFITLKLMGYIDWSWWAVLAPLWVPVSVLLSISLVGCLIVGAITCSKGGR